MVLKKNIQQQYILNVENAKSTKYTTAITCTYGMNPYITVSEENAENSEVQDETVTE